MREYDAKSIKIHSWPELEHLPDGRWKRTWTISLKNEPALSTSVDKIATIITNDIAEDSDSWVREHRGLGYPSMHGDLTIELHLSGSKEIMANLISIGDGQRDEYLTAAWQMLREIDSTIGTIESIEGYTRDSYPPFCWRG